MTTGQDGSRIQEVQAALGAIRQMAGQREVPFLLHRLAEEAARILETERATIFLLDRDRCELISQATLDGHLIRLDARLGIVGDVAMTGRTVSVLDAQVDDRFHQAMDVRTDFRTRSVLAVPVRSAAGEIIGVFEVLNRKKRGAFQAEDVSIAEAVASEAALLLERLPRPDTRERAVPRKAPGSAETIREGEEPFSTRNIVGTSPRIQGIVRLIDLIRDSSVDVLVTGESGTGKELVAKAIHANSPRARHQFVALNCAALPETLAESALFGHEKGAFTSAVAQSIGKFEQAHQGTLFLDEIGDLSLGAQAKILRALQERVIERVGGRTPIPIDVRIIAATHVDLEDAIRQGKFREDLYYRLNVIRAETPPLREIRDDIPVLANHFLEKCCRQMGKDPKRFSSEAMNALTSYVWPGNIRELENEVKRLVVTTRRPVIEVDDLSGPIRSRSQGAPPSPPTCSVQPPPVPSTGAPLKDTVAEVEARLIREALRAHGNNQVKAAKALGLSRQGLIKKMKRHKVSSSTQE